MKSIFITEKLIDASVALYALGWKKCCGGGFNFKFWLVKIQNYFSCIFRLIRGKGGKMAAGSEAVLYLLELAQKQNLVEISDLLDQAVQDVRSQVEGFSEGSELLELTKALENCSNIYLTCERSMKTQVLSDDRAQSIYDDCLNVLQKLCSLSQTKSNETKELQKVATNSIRNVFSHISTKSKEALILQCADTVQRYSQDRQFTYGAGTGEPAGQSHHLSLDVNAALHLLRNLLSVPDGNIPDNLYETLSEVICESLVHVDDHMCAEIIGTILPRMLRNVTKDVKNKHIYKLWTVIQDLFEKFGQKTFRTRSIHPLSERPLMLLCGLADWMFPVDNVMDLEHPVVIQYSFWIILQSGFFQSSPLTRKRALYLLKRILDTVELQGVPLQSLPPDGGGGGDAGKSEPIFWWSPRHAAELSGVWQSFILLIESIAEKQVWFCSVL